MVMIIIQHLERNKISALNNPEGVALLWNKWTKPNLRHDNFANNSGFYWNSYFFIKWKIGVVQLLSMCVIYIYIYIYIYI